LDLLRPSALIAIEKLGPNQQGVYHMVKGHDSSAFQAKAGRLFDAARPRGILTIGVGDRGNEIGMGAIADTVRQVLPYGSICQCPCGGGVADATEVDVVVPGTCSNWGAYGMPPAWPLSSIPLRSSRRECGGAHASELHGCRHGR